MKDETKNKKKKSSKNLNSNKKEKNKSIEECPTLYQLLNVSNSATKDEIVSLYLNSVNHIKFWR